MEKVRAVFKWIAGNIDYKKKLLFNKKEITLNDEKEEVLKSLDERVAESVLQKGFAVCDGEKDSNVGAEPFLDMSMFSTATSALVVPSNIHQNKVEYFYCAASPEIKWLYVQYNNDVIMRYRLVVNNNVSPKEIATK